MCQHVLSLIQIFQKMLEIQNRNKTQAFDGN